MDLKKSRKMLRKEYIKNYKILYYYLKIGGFNRVEIKNGQCVKKSVGNKIYALVSLIVIVSLLLHVFQYLVFGKNTLMPTEIMVDLNFTSFCIILLINVTFFNKRGLDLFRMLIEVDCLIGLKESMFLREQEAVLAKTFCSIASISTFCIFSVITWAYNFPPEIYFTIAAACIIISYIYVDMSCCVVFYLFITMRLTYVNVTLVKLTKMNSEYMIDHYTSMFWKKHFDDKVDFHERATSKQILKLLQAIIELKALSDDCFSCMMAVGALTLIVANFTAVQNLVLYMQSQDSMSLEVESNVMRLGILSFWSASNWLMGLVLVSFANLVHIQSHQTRFICSYNILKTSIDESHVKLCESVLSILEMSDLRSWIYGIYVADPGFILNVAASVSVYTTVQLQLAFGI